MNRIKIACAASIALALAFTISCSSDDGDDGKKDDKKGKPVCYYKNSSAGMCFEGGTGLTEEVCKSMSVYTWEKSGSCPPDENAKCASTYEGGLMYSYGGINICNPE